MTKRICSIGNSAGIIIDKPILDLLKITFETELELSTDGERLVITPLHKPVGRKSAIESAQRRVLRDHDATFRKLSK
ncbi:MAG TPA: AbrB/MazE/SpoVT family DNA-binding domain-containing protein [Planctomycetota bacterium]|jgi:antitoxin component of MazEF toxin-antitoxin module|nr:AbrB/MazE/SpoVT family DNA-binding domain-containing protein [Planctomycetota bacterium]